MRGGLGDNEAVERRDKRKKRKEKREQKQWMKGVDQGRK